MKIVEKKWTTQLFQAIDNQDTEGFVSFLDTNVVFRFGNADPVNGKAATGEVVGGFFGSIKGIKHELVNLWEIDDAVICHGMVTYTRHDSSKLSVPFANIFGMKGKLIKEYQIFVDVSELYK